MYIYNQHEYGNINIPTAANVGNINNGIAATASSSLSTTDTRNTIIEW